MNADKRKLKPEGMKALIQARAKSRGLTAKNAKVAKIKPAEHSMVKEAEPIAIITAQLSGVPVDMNVGQHLSRLNRVAFQVLAALDAAGWKVVRK